MKEKAVSGIGEYHRADIAALHNESGKAMCFGDLGLATLVIEEIIAERFDGGELGDAGINLR